MKNGCRQIDRTHVTSLYMKNIIMSIMLGVALLGSAQACNMQHRAPMHGQPGVHKHVKKHAMHRGHRHGMVKRHHKHHFAARPQMKHHVKPMTMGCARPQFHKKSQWAKPQARQHRHMWGKMGKMQGKRVQKPAMHRQYGQNERTVCHVRKHKFTFGPKRTQKMHMYPLMSLPKHMQPSPEMMKHHAIKGNDKRRG